MVLKKLVFIQPNLANKNSNEAVENKLVEVQNNKDHTLKVNYFTLFYYLFVHLKLTHSYIQRKPSNFRLLEDLVPGYWFGFSTITGETILFPSEVCDCFDLSKWRISYHWTNANQTEWLMCFDWRANASLYCVSSIFCL